MKETKWQALPMELMAHFDDAQEWVLMESIWFKSNIKGFILNLSDLNNDTPIKTRYVLMKVLDRLVQKGWLNKTEIGKSGKHHKYSLNRETFARWIESKMVKKLDQIDDAKRSSNLTKNGQVTRPLNGQENRPNLVKEIDCIDKKENSGDKSIDKPTASAQDSDKLLKLMAETKAAVTLKEKEDFQDTLTPAQLKVWLELNGLEQIQRIPVKRVKQAFQDEVRTASEFKRPVFLSEITRKLQYFIR